jgi:hypothetical protein
MKLVMTYTIGDGCSWHQNVILPIEYESAEALIVNFEQALDKAKDCGESFFKFGEEEFTVNDFFYQDKEWNAKKMAFALKAEDKMLPEIFTLDEWFEKNKIL